ncbi:MAG TPA: hypothetical protein VKU19_13500 [Bryobacteraceae bacterium]|nr:hypothetical protein [Bryobacteraceae bacterium]
MKILIAVMGILWLVLAAPAQRQKRTADVAVLEAKARRAEGKILVDGRVQFTAVKKSRGLIVVFDLLSAEDQVLATEKAVVEEEVIEPGEERSIHAETAEISRAVRFRIRTFDGGDRELRTENPGPYPIE